MESKREQAYTLLTTGLLIRRGWRRLPVRSIRPWVEGDVSGSSRCGQVDPPWGPRSGSRVWHGTWLMAYIAPVDRARNCSSTTSRHGHRATSRQAHIAGGNQEFPRSAILQKDILPLSHEHRLVQTSQRRNPVPHSSTGHVYQPACWMQLSTLRWIFGQLTLDYAGFQKCCAGFALDLQFFVNSRQAKNALLRRNYQLGSVV